MRKFVLAFEEIEPVVTKLFQLHLACSYLGQNAVQVERDAGGTPTCGACGDGQMRCIRPALLA